MLATWLSCVLLNVSGVMGTNGRSGVNQDLLGSGIDGEKYRTACPDYKHYAIVPQYVSRMTIPQHADTNVTTVAL